METQPSPETDTDIRFTNYIYDPVIGKYFAQARFYDSANGRMLAPDPVKRNINPYPYCDNDPVNYNDPTGETANILVGAGLGGFFGGAGNALSEALYGTGPVNSVKDAFIRGARTGAVMSGLENIARAAGLRGAEYGTNPGGGGHSRGTADTTLPRYAGRDPKGMCGASDPFDLTSGLGNGRGYHSGRAHGGAGHSRTGEGGFSLGGFVRDVLTGAVVGGLGSAGFYGAGKAVEELRGSVAGRVDKSYTVPKPNHGQGFSKKGYFPKPGERTFEGFVKEWVPIDAELSLYTKSKEFNNVGNIGGVFKRFGTKFGKHGIAGVHVHQPIRNVNPKTGEIRGGVFNPKKGIGVDSPKRLDIKQLYQFVFNKKYYK